MILLDILMPVMDGITFLRLAAEDERIRSIPIIVLTSDNEMELEAFQLGAMDFIKKPYDMPDIILARVRRIIEFVEDREIIKDVEHDPLTRLYNRSFFFEYTRRLMDSEKDRSFDMLAVDVDRFRIANEVYGRAFGDQVLCALADGIREILQEQMGIGCRADADLFYILLEHGTDLNDILERIRSCVRDGEHQSILRIRMGAYCQIGAEHPVSWYAEAAGSACDSIRGNYQTDVMVYDEALHQRELMNERLIADVDTAIEERQFIVYFQPKYAVQGDRPVLVSAEALVRWDVNRSVNEALFSTGGVPDLDKKIDVRQYVSGINDEANRNENLTYRLSDLINYYPKTEKLPVSKEISCVVESLVTSVE